MISRSVLVGETCISTSFKCSRRISSSNDRFSGSGAALRYLLRRVAFDLYTSTYCYEIPSMPRYSTVGECVRYCAYTSSITATAICATEMSEYILIYLRHLKE